MAEEGTPSSFRGTNYVPQSSVLVDTQNLRNNEKLRNMKQENVIHKEEKR